VVGDDLRQIHWPSTARHDELLVRQQEQPWQGRTTVVLDVRRAAHDAETIEVAVSAAASIVYANSQRNDLVRLVTTEGTDSGFAVGRSHLGAMLEHLAVVEAAGTASLRAMLELLKKGSGGALVVIVANVPGDELSAIARLGRRYGSLTVVKIDGIPQRGARTGAPGRGAPAASNGHTNGNGQANGRSAAKAALPTTDMVHVSQHVPFDIAWNQLLKQRRTRPTRIGAGR
jgi:uncharacterized protein (DUF58 family)